MSKTPFEEIMSKNNAGEKLTPIELAIFNMYDDGFDLDDLDAAANELSKLREKSDDDGGYELLIAHHKEHHAELDALVADRGAWRAALQSLTPGGSEFTEPQECAKYLKEKNADRWEILKRAKVSRDAQQDRADRLQRRCDELEAENEKLKAAMIDDQNDNEKWRGESVVEYQRGYYAGRRDEAMSVLNSLLALQEQPK